MIVVKIYLNLSKEDFCKIQAYTHFQDTSRQMYNLLIKAVENGVSIPDYLKGCNYLIERMVKEKKSVLGAIFPNVYK